MSDKIKIPGLGEVDKKYAIGGALAAVAIVVVVMIRRKGSTSANTAGTAGTAPGDVTGDSTDAIDPATGIPYSEEQASNEAQLSSLGGDEADYGGAGNITPTIDAAGYPIGSTADLAWENTQNGVTTAITSNSQWLTAAETALGDTSAVTEALTKVLGGVTVTSAQRDVFLEGVGAVGQQPPGGYPQPIKLSDTAGAPAASGSSTVKPKAPGGLKATVTSDSAFMTWTKSTGATEYEVRMWKGTPAVVFHTRTVTGESDSSAGLPKGTHIGWHVRAKNTAGYSPYSTSEYFTTKK